MISLPDAPGLSIDFERLTDSKNTVTVPAEQTVSMVISWMPDEACILQGSLQFAWRRVTLHVALSGKAVAPPPSALVYAAVKRAAADIGSSPSSELAVLPQTPTRQQIVKSRRIGISPGHPTFEAAMRNSTIVPPTSRHQAGNTPGLSRYATEAMPKAYLADRREELAASPETAPVSKPKPRLRRPVAAPLRSLKLSVNQHQTDKTAHEAVAAKTANAKAASGLSKAGGTAKKGQAAHRGFSFFHSGQVHLHVSSE